MDGTSYGWISTFILLHIWFAVNTHLLHPFGPLIVFPSWAKWKYLILPIRIGTHHGRPGEQINGLVRTKFWCELERKCLISRYNGPDTLPIIPLPPVRCFPRIGPAARFGVKTYRSRLIPRFATSRLGFISFFLSPCFLQNNNNKYKIYFPLAY